MNTCVITFKALVELFFPFLLHSVCKFNNSACKLNFQWKNIHTYASAKVPVVIIPLDICVSD